MGLSLRSLGDVMNYITIDRGIALSDSFLTGSLSFTILNGRRKRDRGGRKKRINSSSGLGGFLNLVFVPLENLMKGVDPPIPTSPIDLCSGMLVYNF